MKETINTNENNRWGWVGGNGLLNYTSDAGWGRPACANKAASPEKGFQVLGSLPHHTSPCLCLGRGRPRILLTQCYIVEWSGGGPGLKGRPFKEGGRERERKKERSHSGKLLTTATKMSLSQKKKKKKLPSRTFKFSNLESQKFNWAPEA